MNRKKQGIKLSVNNRIIGRMLILVLIIALSLISLYFLIQYQDIRTRAETSILDSMSDPDYLTRDKNYFYVFAMFSGETVNPDSFVDSEELGLNDYYRKNRERFLPGNFYIFQQNQSFLFFYPVPEEERKEDLPEGADAKILYVSCNYILENLRNTILIILGIVAATLLVLFLVSRYTVKILDRKDMGMKNFFANASHELKTPLMAIRGNADGILNGYVDTEEGIRIIEKETDRMAGLIGSIMSFSRLDSGMLKPEMTRNDVREILYDAVSSIIQEAEKNGIRVEVEVPDPLFRECDESMLYSVFSNILSNALRYAQSKISVTGKTLSGTFACLRFSNDGTPIKEEDRIHIFDRFYKGEKGQAGIGMALAQEYARLHDTEITVEVQNGQTTFEIVI